MNLNSIKTNIEFYGISDTYENIHLFDKESDHSDIPKSMIGLFGGDQEHIYGSCCSDFCTIGMSILDNIIPLLLEYKHIPFNEILDKVCNIYKAHCIGDHMLSDAYTSNTWHMLDSIIYEMIIVPITLTKNMGLDISRIKGNGYYSKCTISTYHEKIFNTHKLNNYILSYIYCLFRMFQNTMSPSIRENISNDIKEYISYYNIKEGHILKFLKYYQEIYNLSYTKKNITSLFF